MGEPVHPKLGVCYYPEHWPETWWAEDARRMVDAGLSLVRIGEFAWSRLEPAPGQLSFEWLARAIDILGDAGLRVILGTPTATPPKWLVDQMPDMVARDRDGRPRRFGSRRHYCFSHPGYQNECARIVTALAERFGTHSALIGWQTDNEYGCHDTTLSFSESARNEFRTWLARKYQSPQALNRAWGNVFWSMEVREFDEVELPNMTVTEANPAHWMDFRRFSSDAVVAFNRRQTSILRRLSPGRDITHNFMGRVVDFDHFDVGADLDVSSWDSYPLGFLEDRSGRPEAHRHMFLRSGDPDFQALHHDLYRATSAGRWWVMEQQPGPVNWAPHNPDPRPGMVRLWTLEAVAHGAEAVNYFRWRQAPFAQEQMHAGLLRPDSVAAPALVEVGKSAEDLETIGPVTTTRADVAIVWDYASHWAWEIQRQGAECDQFSLVFDLYAACRGKGLSVDFIDARSGGLAQYPLVLVPGLFTWTPALRDALATAATHILVGPRTGSKTPDFGIPDTLPPDLPKDLLDLTISRIETLPKGIPVIVEGGGKVQFWREFCDVGKRAETVMQFEDGSPALVTQGPIHYLCGWPDAALAARILGQLCDKADIATRNLPAGLRIRRAGDMLFVLNYGGEPVDLSPLELGSDQILGPMILPPADVAIFRDRGPRRETR